ncbi:uncharacterized protein LOC144531185 isoform X1 [Sander vitreus]
MEYRQPLGQRKVLVSSWLREGPLIKDARYNCVAEASTGNDVSEVDLRLTIGDEESIPSRDLNQWRGALTEHEQLLKRWEKAWVGLCLCMKAVMATELCEYVMGFTCVGCIWL